MTYLQPLVFSMCSAILHPLDHPLRLPLQHPAGSKTPPRITEQQIQTAALLRGYEHMTAATLPLVFSPLQNETLTIVTFSKI